MRRLAIIITFTLVLGACGDRYVEELIEQHGANFQNPVAVIAFTDVTEVTIGDKIRYAVAVISDPGINVRVPQSGDEFGEFKVKDFGESPSREFRGKNVTERWYTLVIYDIGSHTIPAPVAKFTASDGAEVEVEGNEVSVEVMSVIPDGEEPEDIKDIADPVNLPVDYAPYILIGIAVVVLVGAGIAVYILLRRREQVEEQTPPRPAHEIAYEQLRHIAEAKLVEAGEIEKYYVLLSAVVRHYLENRFDLRAPEMTTEEFLQAAASADQLVQRHRTLLQDFLTESDMVKFAQYGPNEEQMKTAFEYAKRFVDETLMMGD